MFIELGGIILRFLLNVVRNFISIISFAPFWPDVDEADIGKNIRFLKKYEWFQQYLENENFKELIVYDQDVRDRIGEFNSNRLKKESYQNQYEKKIRKILLKKVDSFA